VIDFGGFMVITSNFCIVCEDFRMEVNGKFILIGVLANGFATPQLPCQVPSLTFFQSFGTDEVGTKNFTATLRALDSGAVVATAKGQFQAAVVAPIILPVKLQNLRFMSFGAYTWSFEVEGQEPFLTEFPITHNAGNQGIRVVQPPIPGR
jgi:hypothetical protein